MTDDSAREQKGGPSSQHFYNFVFASVFGQRPHEPEYMLVDHLLMLTLIPWTACYARIWNSGTVNGKPIDMQNMLKTQIERMAERRPDLSYGDRARSVQRTAWSGLCYRQTAEAVVCLG